MARTATRYSAAHAVLIVAGVIAGVIVLGIMLVLVDANPANGIVNAILDVAHFFARPFENIFPQDTQEMNVLVNWGIAAVAYLGVGVLIARFARR